MIIALRAAKSNRLVAVLGAALVAISALSAAGPAQAGGPARAGGSLRSPVPASPGTGWPHWLGLGMARDAAGADRSGELDGVFCTAPSNCWAVGNYTVKSATLNQVLHWTGKKWFAG